MKKTIAACVVSMGIGMALVAGPVLARGAMRGHPNLIAAQKDIDMAWTKITAAQKANEFDLDGHAQKAKDALKVAADEIKLAAQTSNANHR